MKYVIDTSVDIKTYVQEHDSTKAVRLRNDYHRGLHDLLAPDIFPTEMCNVLVILERSGKVKPGEAELFFRQTLSALPLSLPPFRCCHALLNSQSSFNRRCTTVFTSHSRSAKVASW